MRTVEYGILFKDLWNIRFFEKQKNYVYDYSTSVKNNIYNILMIRNIHLIFISWL